MTNQRVAIALLLLTRASNAVADGETTPIIGVAVVGGEAARTPESQAELAGVGLDVAWWHGRFGLAGEASGRWGLDPAGVRAFVLAGSARIRVLEHMMPSLLDPRDCEMGLELQAIIERAWWNTAVSDAQPTAFGVGAAFRFRGMTDPGDVIAESRFFLRVMSAAWTESAVIARTMSPAGGSDRALTVLAGIGASFGGGTPSYMARFQPHPFGHAILW